MNKQNIVSTMIEQHRNLQKEVVLISEIIKENKIDAKKIVKSLKKFKKNLIEHLKLENEVFYADLLKVMKAKGQDTTKTEMFIDEMKGIEKVVVAFLEKYKDEKSVNDKIDEFKKELPSIGETLNLRIESEEAGVYAYWGLF